MQRAILIMFLAMSLIPAGDTAGKLLTMNGHTSPGFVAWSRFLVGVVLILPFTPRSAWGLLRDWRIWLRGALIACGISCIQIALSRAPIADVFAAFFIGPLISYAMAAVFLREPITWQRTALILIGFCGVLVVVQPGSDASPALFWAVAAGMCYGAFLTASRWLSHLGSPIALSFTQLFIAGLILTPFNLTGLPEFTPYVTTMTFLSGLGSMLGNLLLLYAYRIAPATRLAPLVYFQLFAAVLFGWFVFSTWPTAMTWVGLLIVMAAGVTSARLKT